MSKADICHIIKNCDARILELKRITGELQDDISREAVAFVNINKIYNNKWRMPKIR